MAVVVQRSEFSMPLNEASIVVAIFQFGAEDFLVHVESVPTLVRSAVSLRSNVARRDSVETFLQRSRSFVGAEPDEDCRVTRPIVRPMSSSITTRSTREHRRPDHR